MKQKLILFSLITATVLLAAGKEELREYPYVRQAKLTGNTGKVTAIRLDPKLYRNTNTDYSNVRITDQNGNTVPFAVRISGPFKTVESYVNIPGSITGFSVDRKTNTATAEFTFKETGEVSRLSLPTTSKRFDKKVTVIFFDKNGKQVGEQKDLSLFQYGKVFGSAHVDFPAVKADKLKVIIHNFAERKESAYRRVHTGETGQSEEKNIYVEEYNLKGISAFQKKTETQRGPANEVDIDLPEISHQTKGNITEILVDAHRVPCCKLSVNTDDLHYNRLMEVFSKEENREIRIFSGQISPEQKEIKLPEYRGEYYIIRIHNGNNQPLKNIRLHWKTLERTFVFLPPDSPGDLKLYYGGKANKQLYDIEKYADNFGLPSQVYQLGEEAVSPYFAPELPKETIYQYLLWFILGIIAVTLFIVIIRLLNKNTESEDQA